ncbi:phage N-6-adenine-methyltransferase [Pectobacterium punjabense]|uniref:phage N-6-adenine-methyltransferase n=1 Tax=Pectobacterium punjabense TaxID=2108399 RepID=UPI0024062B82|nr:phage N-6-adenine-methyltransferase [Pectobacterium punjabense]MDG0795669.1 phage N-6-adenine-methyltransferase [Pectobacterium punjabense]
MINFSGTEYVSSLQRQKSEPAHLLKDVGDQWRTPEPLFWGINAMFGPLVLDLFTDGENSKCPAFYTAEDNALAQDWAARLADLNGAAFANPPYSTAKMHEGEYITGMRHIMAHTDQMRERGGRYVFLIKSATSEVWWPEQADHVAFIRGRIGFDVPTWFKPKDDKQIPSSAGFGAAITVFDKEWRGPTISYIQREKLLATGEAFLAQIRREAGRLAPQQSIIIPDTENAVWPAEVNFLFERVSTATTLPAGLQNKLRSHINRLKLEGVPDSAIITTAETLSVAMGAAA